jgi:serine protease AprX
MVAAVFVLGAPLMASASSGKSNTSRPSIARTYVSPGLMSKAGAHPNQKIRVIVTANQGALPKSKILGVANALSKRELNAVHGIALYLPAKQLAKVAGVPGLTITPDAPVKVSGYTSTQLWAPNTGIQPLWGLNSLAGTAFDQYALKPPAIAVVDSGVDTSKVADFGGRVIQQVKLGTLPNDSAGDGRGHGTFVAGMAAGQAAGYAGASPRSNIVSLDVMDNTGMARTSDVIAAAQWILKNKDQYNIRVANFSLHSSTESNFTRDPLDRAVEQLWFNGVTVVAAAGNYGSPSGPSGVKYAPGNDPFVITVGAADMNGDPFPSNDTAAPFSAWGHTLDGFEKPEISTQGRYIVGPVPMTSTLAGSSRRSSQRSASRISRARS